MLKYVASVLCVATLTGCTVNTGPAPQPAPPLQPAPIPAPPLQPAPGPAYIPWDDAVRLLNEGRLVSVWQIGTDVELAIREGSTVKTVQPYINAIEDEVRNCGAPCANVIMTAG